MTTSDLLERAWQRIKDPARWCQGRSAQDSQGRSVDAFSKHAHQWCASGSVWADIHAGYYDASVAVKAEWLLEDAAANLFGILDIVFVNDTLGHKQTGQMYQRAIALANAEEGT